jgi:hypothetical protein
VTGLKVTGAEVEAPVSRVTGETVIGAEVVTGARVVT